MSRLNIPVPDPDVWYWLGYDALGQYHLRRGYKFAAPNAVGVQTILELGRGQSSAEVQQDLLHLDIDSAFSAEYARLLAEDRKTLLGANSSPSIKFDLRIAEVPNLSGGRLESLRVLDQKTPRPNLNRPADDDAMEVSE